MPFVTTGLLSWILETSSWSKKFKIKNPEHYKARRKGIRREILQAEGAAIARESHSPQWEPGLRSAASGRQAGRRASETQWPPWPPPCLCHWSCWHLPQSNGIKHQHQPAQLVRLPVSVSWADFKRRGGFLPISSSSWWSSWTRWRRRPWSVGLCAARPAWAPAASSLPVSPHQRGTPPLFDRRRWRTASVREPNKVVTSPRRCRRISLMALRTNTSHTTTAHTQSLKWSFHFPPASHFLNHLHCSIPQQWKTNPFGVFFFPFSRFFFFTHNQLNWRSSTSNYWSFVSSFFFSDNEVRLRKQDLEWTLAWLFLN